MGIDCSALRKQYNNKNVQKQSYSGRSIRVCVCAALTFTLNIKIESVFWLIIFNTPHKHRSTHVHKNEETEEREIKSLMLLHICKVKKVEPESCLYGAAKLSNWHAAAAKQYNTTAMQETIKDWTYRSVASHIHQLKSIRWVTRLHTTLLQTFGLLIRSFDHSIARWKF